MRCVRAAEFEQVLNTYHDEVDHGYTHQVLVHVPQGHNYNDWGDSEAEVLADPAAFADPAITEAMMNRFLEVLISTAQEDDMGSLSYYPEEGNDAFNQAIRSVVTEEFHLQTAVVNANAVRYVSQFTRNPAPEIVLWDLGTRAASRRVTSFYWLKADHSVTEGIITAYLSGDNTLTVIPKNVNGDFSILVHPKLLDVSRPILIITPEGEYEVRVNPSWDTMLDAMTETGDPDLAWAAEIPYSALH